MRFLRSLLGIRNCSLCGEKANGKWEKMSRDLWEFFSSERKIDFHVNLKVNLEVEGLCGKCFKPRSDLAIEAIRGLFRDVPARKEELVKLCSK